MLLSIVALFCILWFSSVWICILKCPFRLCCLLFPFKAVKTCYAKASAKDKQRTTENHLKQ